MDTLNSLERLGREIDVLFLQMLKNLWRKRTYGEIKTPSVEKDNVEDQNKKLFSFVEEKFQYDFMSYLIKKQKGSERK